jgi:hypothetical protein
VIFNAHRAIEGELPLARDPLRALTARPNGIDAFVAFLTANVKAQAVVNVTIPSGLTDAAQTSAGQR